MHDAMHNDGFTFVVHLNILTPLKDMDPKVSKRIDELPKRNIFVLCGLMRLDRAFSTASLVINHGGHGGMMSAAMSGLPQLILPTSCVDQLTNGLMAQDARIGKLEVMPHLRYKAAKEKFVKCVRAFCDDPTYQANAREFADRYKGTEHNGISAVLTILNHVYVKTLSLRQQEEDAEYLKGHKTSPLGRSKHVDNLFGF